MVSADSWLFDQPRDCAVLVTREVLERSEPILHLTRDSDDHGWQFVGFSDGTSENGRVIALHEVVELALLFCSLPICLLAGAPFAIR